jgi:hypothetical protein
MFYMPTWLLQFLVAVTPTPSPSVAAPTRASGTPVWLSAIGIGVALLAVLVALFKDEYWHWRHAPKVDVGLRRDQGRVLLVLCNPSSRVAAQSASVRVTQVRPHPWVAAMGVKDLALESTIVDRLLRRPSGEDRFDIAPGGEAQVEVAHLRDGYGPEDPVVAKVAWGAPAGCESVHEIEGEMIVLPSWTARLEWGDRQPPMNSPAVIQMEVAAANVPARIWSLMLWRDPAMPPADGLAAAQTRYGGMTQADLTPGSDVDTLLRVRRQRTDEGQAMEVWRRQYDERKRELDSLRRQRPEQQSSTSRDPPEASA